MQEEEGTTHTCHPSLPHLPSHPPTPVYILFLHPHTHLPHPPFPAPIPCLPSPANEEGLHTPILFYLQFLPSAMPTTCPPLPCLPPLPLNFGEDLFFSTMPPPFPTLPFLWMGGWGTPAMPVSAGAPSTHLVTVPAGRLLPRFILPPPALPATFSLPNPIFPPPSLPFDRFLTHLAGTPFHAPFPSPPAHFTRTHTFTTPHLPCLSPIAFFLGDETGWEDQDWDGGWGRWEDIAYPLACHLLPVGRISSLLCPPPALAAFSATPPLPYATILGSILPGRTACIWVCLCSVLAL